LPSAAITSEIPGSAFGRLAASGGRTGAGLSRNGNFEGFYGKNDLCVLSMSSVTSEDESVTPAQRPGMQRN
jgi:hypothetical protein